MEPAFQQAFEWQALLRVTLLSVPGGKGNLKYRSLSSFSPPVLALI